MIINRAKMGRHLRTAGFTLLELLIVIVVIAILVGQLWPLLCRARQQALKAQCLSNQRQIGIGLKLYAEDYLGTFPPARQSQLQPSGTTDYIFAEALGGGDPSLGLANSWPSASSRPLAAYVPGGEAFRCPADRGIELAGMELRPTLYEARGCSYRFNHALQGFYENAGLAEDPVYNLAGKKDWWPPSPSRFIMLHEPAAYAWDQNGTIEFTAWHGAGQPGKTFNPNTVSQCRDKFVAPVLFVDGHSRTCDFSEALRTRPGLSLEPEKDWIWYKPLH